MALAPGMQNAGNQDTIQEFKVITSGASAEFNKANKVIVV